MFTPTVTAILFATTFASEVNVPRRIQAETLKPVRNPLNGHYYAAVLPGARLSWEDANKTAQELTYKGEQGHLVTITSASENQFLLDNFPQAIQNGVWYGGYKVPDGMRPDTGWRWVTGELWNYANWEMGEPNNDDGHSDRLAPFPNGRWNDCPKDELKPACIVEFEAPQGITALEIQPSPIVGGMDAVMQVTFPQAVPKEGTTILLRCDLASVTVPDRVKVPSGVRTFTFLIRTTPVTSFQNGKIMVTYQGVEKTCAVTVRPVGVALLELIPVPVAGGQTVQGQVTLEAAAGLSDIYVTLAATGNRSLVNLPSRLRIPVGQISATFPLKTRPTLTLTQVVITATTSGKAAKRTLILVPKGRIVRK